MDKSEDNTLAKNAPRVLGGFTKPMASGNAPKDFDTTVALQIADAFSESDNGEVMTLQDQRCIGHLLDLLPALPRPLNHLAALIKCAEAGRRVVLTSGVRKAVRQLVRHVEGSAH